jgi:hypothetical protein
MDDPPAEPRPEPTLIPPPWFVANFNAGVSQDWAGEGPPPYRTALDPLVMFSWHQATEHRADQLLIITGI